MMSRNVRQGLASNSSVMSVFCTAAAKSILYGSMMGMTGISRAGGTAIMRDSKAMYDRLLNTTSGAPMYSA